MKRVFLVDESTRIILPETAWGDAAVAALIAQGHRVTLTDQDPDLCERDDEELHRMINLLDSTGI